LQENKFPVIYFALRVTYNFPQTKLTHITGSAQRVSLWSKHPLYYTELWSI